MYVVARSKDSNTIPASNYFQTLYALDVTNGTILAWQDISATLANGNARSFDPLHENQRGALLFQSGQVYVTWASHCDKGIQHPKTASWYGWLMSYKLQGTTLQQTGAWTTTEYPEGGIWQSGSGPAGDGSGTNLYLAVGNGSTTAAPQATEGPCTNCFGNSIVKINGTPSGGTFTVLDSFTPYDHPYRFCNDSDVGNAGVILIQGSGFNVPNLLVQSGKEGNVYLLNMTTGQMGGYTGALGSFTCPVTKPTGNDNIVSFFNGDTTVNANGMCYDTATECGTQGSPVFWNNNIFFGPRCQPIKQIALAGSPVALGYVTATTQGGVVDQMGCKSPNPVFHYPGAQMAVSQYKTGGAILRALDNSKYAHSPPFPAVLYAYDANNIAAAPLFSATVGSGGAVKFAVPTVANGHVYVGGIGQLVVFH